VHVQCECSDALAEAEYVESVSSVHPEVGGIIPYANLADSDISEKLKTLSSLPHVKGIRQLLNWHSTNESLRDTPIEYARDSEEWQSNYSLLDKYGLHYEFHGFSTQLDTAATLAKRYPNIPMVINHSGLLIDFTESGWSIWRKNLAALSELPNVSIKIIGMAMIDHHYTVQSFQLMIDFIISHFGVDRCMFASNFPIEKAVTDYNTLFHTFKTVISHYSPEEQKKMMHDNAIKFYRL